MDRHFEEELCSSYRIRTRNQRNKRNRKRQECNVLPGRKTYLNTRSMRQIATFEGKKVLQVDSPRLVEQERKSIEEVKGHTQGMAGVREVTAEEEYNGGFLHLRRKIKRADYSENPSTNGDLRERERNRVEKMENKPLRKLGVLGMNTRN